jgi:hypothetical protein
VVRKEFLLSFIVFTAIWAHADEIPNCDSLLSDHSDHSEPLRIYQAAPSTEFKIQILQAYPSLIPDSQNQIRILAIKSIVLDLEAKREDFTGVTVVALRALGDTGLAKDAMLFDQVIRSGKAKAALTATISKEHLMARIENRPANVDEVLKNSPITQKTLLIFKNASFAPNDVVNRLLTYEPFIVAEERQILLNQLLQFARSEIQFMIYGLENDYYSFSKAEEKSPAYHYLEFIAAFGENADVKFLEKFMMLLAPKLEPSEEEIHFRNYLFEAAGRSINQLRNRLRMPLLINDTSGQGD